jgi:hypothetical protein
MREAPTVILTLLTFTLPAVAGLVDPYRDVLLSQADREAVERVACLEPFKVEAAEIGGARYADRKGGPLFARVKCWRHLVTPEFSAYAQRFCEKKWRGWHCHDPSFRVVASFLGRGPFVMPVEGLDPPAGYASLQCLARGLEAQDIRNLRATGELYSLRVVAAHAATPAVVEAYLENENGCSWIQFPQACDARSDVQLTLSASGCFEE